MGTPISREGGKKTLTWKKKTLQVSAGRSETCTKKNRNLGKSKGVVGTGSPKKWPSNFQSFNLGEKDQFIGGRRGLFKAKAKT